MFISTLISMAAKKQYNLLMVSASSKLMATIAQYYLLPMLLLRGTIVNRTYGIHKNLYF